MSSRILKAQRGFTLIELLAVIAILTVLAGIVAGAVTGVGAGGQNARLQVDADTIGKAADRFFNEGFPQRYPVVPCCEPTDATPSDIMLAGDLGVRLIDFELPLPGDPLKTFVPDFLKEIPDTAALVSWRVVTATGRIFFAEDGTQLVRPSDARLDVSAVGPNGSIATASRLITTQSDYTLKLRMNKHQAALEILVVTIPAGYSIGGQSQPDGAVLGILSGKFSADNPWIPGVEVGGISGTLTATGLTNEWKLSVLYPDSVNGTGTFSANAPFARADRTATAGTHHRVSIAEPSSEAPGAIKIVLNTTGDQAHNQALETWELTICGKPQISGSSTTCGNPTADNLITNPSVKGVYRWLATQHSSIDIPDLFSGVAGNQAVVIK